MARRRFPISALRLCPIVLLLGAPPALSAAAEGAASGPVQPWTVDDLLLTERVGEMLLSADGSLAVWTRTTFEPLGDGEGEAPEMKRVGHVFMARLDAAGDGPIEPVQLTRGPTEASGLALSPDARHLAFLSKREQPGRKDVEGRHVWILPLGGGEAWPLTSEKRAIQSVDWIDADSLLISRPEDPSAVEQRREKTRDTATVVEALDENPPVRLFVVPLDGESRRLTEDDDWIEQVAVAPGGGRAVLTAGQSLSYTFDSKVPPRTFLVDLESGERDEILEGLNLLPRRFAWSEDGGTLYFVDDRSNHPLYRNATVAELYRFDLESRRAEKIDLDWPRGLGGGFGLAEVGPVGLLADGVRYRPALLAPDRQRLSGPHAENLDRLVTARDARRVLYLTSSADSAPQLFAATLDGDRLVGERRLGHLNPSFDRRPSGRTEIVRWTGALDEEVEGVLSYPFDYREGERYPLILDIHGGPTGYDRDAWDASWGSPTPLWRQRGAFVLRVNYHGSGNYGLEWAESIQERYYELEIPDIESGVDALIARGLVDPERLATSGWSNGGILSAGLIVETDRYRAAIIGAADVEWISDWGNVDFGAAFDNYYFGGPPWERLDHYIEKSPFFRLTEVTTPSLVHTGTEDRAVPPHQSWSLFRAMQQIGKADVRLVLYPGEPHGLRQLEHQRRKVEEDLAWFDRYLFETQDEARDQRIATVPAGSPLDAALLRARAERQDRGLGVLRGGHLVPEAVPYAGLLVSRFETTRGQWSAYLEATGHEAPQPGPDEADLPVVGLTVEQAEAYAAWLAETTGEPWRLPTVAEAERLAGKGGNTLEAWLGYRPNPDDLEAVRRQIDAAGLDLIKPVGSHAGTRSPGPRSSGRQDGPAVFDLDGNAAEWATAPGGTGQPVGPSAERPSGSKERPAPGYLGFRVVRDLPNVGAAEVTAAGG